MKRTNFIIRLLALSPALALNACLWEDIADRIGGNQYQYEDENRGNDRVTDRVDSRHDLVHDYDDSFDDDTGNNIRRASYTTSNGNTFAVVSVSGTLRDNIVFRKGTAYVLEGKVFVGQDAGASVPYYYDNYDSDNDNSNDNRQVTLTIEPGARIYAHGSDSGLVVSRGSRIIARGSRADPIVFTSVNQLEREYGYLSPNHSARGEWMGIIINGRAPINGCNALTAPSGVCEARGIAGSGLYGGNSPNDSSGILSYVRIEHAAQGQLGEYEAGSLTLQGVGSGTDIQHVQIHNSGDDGISFFGGTVGARNLVITGAKDDSIDWNNGWKGTVQYVMAKQTDGLGSNLIEGDNNHLDPARLPVSSPDISHFTLIGIDNGQSAILLRSGTGGRLSNGLVFDPQDGGLELADEATRAMLHSTALDVYSVTFRTNSDVSGGSVEQNAAIKNTLLSKQTLFVVPEVTNISDSDLFDQSLRATNNKDIGAFGLAETWSNNWATGWTREVFTGFVQADDCPNGTITSGTINDNGITKTVCTLSGEILHNLTLHSGNKLVYRLEGKVVVGRDSGTELEPIIVDGVLGVPVTLSINPGVTIFGRELQDGLIISRGSVLSASGSETSPIRFTSGLVLDNYIPGQYATGHWMGLIINGRSHINNCALRASVPGSSNCQNNGVGGSGRYGGSLSNDNSGTLRYVRVEYAGANLEGEEIGGIVFQGVGDGTTVEHIQVHNSAHDGISFVGGTVDVGNLVITGAIDDSIDWNNGWKGNLTYVIIEQIASSGYAFEGDNNISDNRAIPASNPNIANFTILGAGTSGGLFLGSGTAGDIVNGIIVDSALPVIDPSGLSNYLLACDDRDELTDYTRSYDYETDLIPVTPQPQVCNNYVAHAKDHGLNIDSLLIDLVPEATSLVDMVSGDDAALGFTQADIARALGNTRAVASTVHGYSFFGRSGQGLTPGLAEQSLSAGSADRLNDDYERYFDNDTAYIGAVRDINDKWYLGWTIDGLGNLTSK